MHDVQLFWNQLKTETGWEKAFPLSAILIWSSSFYYLILSVHFKSYKFYPFLAALLLAQNSQKLSLKTEMC